MSLNDAGKCIPATVHFPMRLALVPGIGPKSYRMLLQRFGSAERVFRASYRELLAIPGIGNTLARRIQDAAHRASEQRVLELCQSHNIKWVFLGDPHYPRLLSELQDAPVLLFYRGQFQVQHHRAVAIVGTRYPTAYGLRQADRLARQLVEAGYTIVSGLARGIDGAAHRAALAAGGNTIAVLGGGLLELYPAEHRMLADQIAAHGVLLSELPPDHPPRSGNFPQRNRIISGLSLGVVVIEAGIHSGALITAHHAADQGREVFAVPGSVENPTARGCHQLIREGAKLVESVHDILEELDALICLVESTAVLNQSNVGTDPPNSPAMDPAVTLTPSEQRLWCAIDPNGSLLDELIATSGLTPRETLIALVQLELKHLVRRVGGAMIVRSHGTRR